MKDKQPIAHAGREATIGAGILTQATERHEWENQSTRRSADHKRIKAVGEGREAIVVMCARTETGTRTFSSANDNASR